MSMKPKHAPWIVVLVAVFACPAQDAVLAQSNGEWTGITFDEFREAARGLPKSPGRIQAIRLFPEAAPSGIVVLSLIPQRGWQVLVFRRMPRKHFRLAWGSDVLSERDGMSSSSGKELTIGSLGQEKVVQFQGCVTHACPDDFGVLIYALSSGRAFQVHYQFGQIRYSAGLELPENLKYKSYLDERIRERVGHSR